MTRKQKKMLLRILIAGALMAGLAFVPVRGWARFALYLVPYFIVGWDILRGAAIGVLNRQVFDENFLMAVATVGALVIGITQTGDYVEAVAVMLFYQVGELFQSYAVGKSRRNISALMDIRPDYANVEKAGVITQTDPEAVEVGCVLVVRPGERIPIDGIVVEGSSVLDTAALTGESQPREISPGEEVLSGCINLSGVLRIRTTKPYTESTVTQILELVENASARKSKSEKFISRFARYYTPFVCYAALALALLPPVIRIILGLNGVWGEWLYRALTFLVISCPCALVISIPLTFFAGIGAAGKAGVLVKGANYLEALSKVSAVVMDKTGTLTQGKFRVEQVLENTMDGEKLLELAALAESASSHPISQSLRSACSAEPDTTRVTRIFEHSGRGVTAIVDGREVAVGNEVLLQELGVAFTACHEAGTLVYVAVDGIYCGCILIRDSIKPTAAQAVGKLKKLGIRRIVMLTGDSESAANHAAGELGITEVYSRLLPGDKVQKVEQLMEQGEKVAFVGDGINDAPVLGRADVGIAMGALGSDAAIEAADVVLMDDDPQKLVTAMKLSAKCMAIVHQNIWFALGIKLVCLILGALGFANMWLAIFADVGVMVLAVLNAVRVLFMKRR